MVVDGRTIAQSILQSVKSEVSALPRAPRLTIFTCVPNFETKKYLALKQHKAAEVGIDVAVIEFAVDTTVEAAKTAVLAAHSTSDGIIIQLPLPLSLSAQSILKHIKPSHDVDVFSYDGSSTNILPPVIGAIDAIVRQYQVTLVGKRVVVVGTGRLVGAPAVLYAKANGALVTIIQKHTTDTVATFLSADVLILGAGSPGVVTAAMVKEGVVVFDAGTTEANGILVGDAASDMVEKSALLTPVPGGIGPITVAVLLRNLVRLVK